LLATLAGSHPLRPALPLSSGGDILLALAWRYHRLSLASFH